MMRAFYHTVMLAWLSILAIGFAHAALQAFVFEGEQRIRTIERSANLNTPVEWGLEVPESVLPVKPKRKPE